MGKGKTPKRREAATQNRVFDQARDELFSHILRCGVLEAAADDRKEWFDDTMEYLAERYDGLTPAEVVELRGLGERYCQPVIQRSETVLASH
jgi:hypothetical protein